MKRTTCPGVTFAAWAVSSTTFWVSSPLSSRSINGKACDLKRSTASSVRTGLGAVGDGHSILRHRRYSRTLLTRTNGVKRAESRLHHPNNAVFVVYFQKKRSMHALHKFPFMQLDWRTTMAPIVSWNITFRVAASTPQTWHSKVRASEEIWNAPCNGNASQCAGKSCGARARSSATPKSTFQGPDLLRPARAIVSLVPLRRAGPRSESPRRDNVRDRFPTGS